MVAILDYGIGNVSSILNMLKKAGAAAKITSDPAFIQEADKLILPGVGHFDYCMQQLQKASFHDLLQRRVLEEKVPILGVCVGCQMLMESSEEGNEKGLGWIEGKVVKFDRNLLSPKMKIPHMGWNDIHPVDACMLYENIEEPRFYFTHSYHLVCKDTSKVTATSEYGYSFTASVRQDNIMGVQFHPEKSHRFGMQLYQNFVKNY
jgi:imidazole glycerol-phosphate synthase subunit HisH